MDKKLLVNTNGPKTIEDFNTLKSEITNKENLIKRILIDKTPQYTEIEVSFFQLCDLHCKFCWQDNYNDDGITSIVDKSQTVIDYLEKNKKMLLPNIQVHLLGGELFEDQNDYYEDYYLFIKNIFDYCQEVLPEKNLLFVFLTNMNFQKQQTLNKLDNFVNKLKSEDIKFTLTTSWDPTGRPLAGELTTQFHRNITYFKEDLSEITFVMTKQTIKKLLKDKNVYLSYLYENEFTLDYDYYMPTDTVHSQMPTDWELLNGIRYLLNKFPKIRKLQAFVDNHGNPGKLTCASLNKITILPDGTITNCKHLDYSPQDFETAINKESNADMILNFITKKECLSCKYFRDCPMSCFLMADHKKFSQNTQLDECLYKIIFRERDERNEKSDI